MGAGRLFGVLDAKQMELLRELAPKAAVIAVLISLNNGHLCPQDSQGREASRVRAQNLVRLDLVTESPTVGRDGRTTTILVEPAWLALQVQELPCG